MPSLPPTPIYCDIKAMSEILGAIQSAGALKIISLLITSEKRICEVAKLSGQTQASVYQHVKAMSRAGVVSIRKEGRRNTVCRINERPREAMKVILQVLKTFRHPRYQEDAPWA
jgi:DNA-binding transcriptional ArsR family regulator